MKKRKIQVVHCQYRVFGRDKNYEGLAVCDDEELIHILQADGTTLNVERLKGWDKSLHKQWMAFRLGPAIPPED